MSRLLHVLGRYVAFPIAALCSLGIVLVLITSAARQPRGQFPAGGDLFIRGDASLRQVYLGYERPVGRPVLDEQGQIIRERLRESNVASFSPLERRWIGRGLGRGFGYSYRQRSPDVSELMTTFGPPDPQQARFRALVRNPSLLPNTRIETCSVSAPTWFVLLLVGAAPAWYFAFPYRRYRLRCYRQEHGLCLSCGYDLRGTPERCSECGETH